MWKDDTLYTQTFMWLLLLVLWLSCTSPTNGISLEGKFTIENQLVERQYSVVGSLQLTEGKYHFTPDSKYE